MLARITASGVDQKLFFAAITQREQSKINADLLTRSSQHVQLHREPSVKLMTLLIATVLIAAAADAADSTACPPGNRSVGAQPPKGHEWKCVNKDGVPDGPWRTWYDGGQLMSERQMKLGKEHGRQRSWWPNGQLMMEGISVDGNRYKGFKYWSITGQPTDLNIETQTITKPLQNPTATGAKP